MFEIYQMYKYIERYNDDEIVGLSLRCVACKNTEQIFNGSRDGYDGQLGHNDDLSGEVSSRAILDEQGEPYPHGLVRVAFTYNGSEYINTALEEGQRPVDFFDWFDGLLLVNDEWVNVVTYECA